MTYVKYILTSIIIILIIVIIIILCKRINYIEELCTDGLPDEYHKYGCNLHSLYNDCMSCEEEGQYGKFENNKVKCYSECDHSKNFKRNCHYFSKEENNCLNNPGHKTLPGFGCPGRKKPIDPKKNKNNLVCHDSSYSS